MSSIKSVAVGGATGNLGPSIVDGLLQAGFSVTVLTRKNSDSKPPSGVKVAPVDYDSVESLTTALKGLDAVVSTLNPGVVDQIPLVDAAIAAGVSRFLPSEFGCDAANPKVRELPVFGAKVKVSDYLAEKAKEGKISYSLVVNGPFLDWGLQFPVLVNLKDVTDVFDGGDRPASATNLADIGRAVAGTLKNPKETANRAVYVQSAVVTQNGLLATAKKVTGKEYETRPVDSLEHEKEARDALKRGDTSKLTNFIRRAMWGEGFGSKFDTAKLDNELFGVKELTEKQLEELVEKYT